MSDNRLDCNGLSHLLQKIKEWISNAPSGGSDDTKMDKENPTGSGALSIGRKSGSEIGLCSSAVGDNVVASGYYSHSEGTHSTASGNYSHVEGAYCASQGEYSHAEGNSTTALGRMTHTEGNNTSALGDYSHAEGDWNVATGDGSHAEGTSTQANGFCSHTEGFMTIANGEQQHVSGKYNIVDDENKYAEIIGGGTSESDRKNIRTLDWQGNTTYAGNVTDGNGYTLKDAYEMAQAGGGSSGTAYEYDKVYDTGDTYNGKPVYLVITHYASVTGKLANAVYLCTKILPESVGTIETTVRITGVMNVDNPDKNRVTLPSVNPSGLK